MKIDLKSWLVGLILGLCGKPLPFIANKTEETEKTIIGYSYNGVVLPKLPERDKEKYPRLYITGNASLAYLYALPDGEYLFDGSRWVIPSGVYGLFVQWYPSKGNEWGALSESHLGGRYAAPIWCNTDILNEDGTVYLAASEPVPVYE